MGSGENEAPKSSTQAQDQPPATSSTPSAPAYPDWSGFQAYSPIPPHGFFPSPVASGSPAHPYMWGPQAIMPPYGTPPPPYVMYPPGIYAHPSIPPASHPFSPYAIPSPVSNAEALGTAAGGVEGPSPEGKERSPLKGSKGSLGSLNMITGKNNNDPGKTSGASANGGISRSGESGSEDSSDGSDVNSQNDFQPKTSGGQDSYDAEAPQNGNHARSSRNGVTGTPSQLGLSQTMAVMPIPAAGVPGGVAGPTTNLNIGMDYWGATTSTPIPPIRAKVPCPAVGGAMVPGGPSEMWIQDERELKRQRRKQSNRESARRSRLRKQAECEELAQRVEVLKEENASLRAELNHIRNEYDQLLSQNTALKEKLGEAPRGEDSKVDRNGQHSLDIQAAQNDTAEGGR